MFRGVTARSQKTSTRTRRPASSRKSARSSTSHTSMGRRNNARTIPRALTLVARLSPATSNARGNQRAGKGTSRRRAIVAQKPGGSLSEADLDNWLRQRLAHFKVPKSIVFVEALPKTAANKVDKQALVTDYGS